MSHWHEPPVAETGLRHAGSMAGDGGAVMHPGRRRSLVLWVATAAGLIAAPSAIAAREISWLDLVPADWKPQERIEAKKAEAANLKDEDDLAQVLMRELREILDTAPTVGRFDGSDVRLPGYVVPLQVIDGGLTEFLLVPYFGACIHVPPPPANQIVHVTSRRPVKGFGTMSAVWVSGTFRSARHTSEAGVSGYGMQLSEIRPFEPPTR